VEFIVHSVTTQLVTIIIQQLQNVGSKMGLTCKCSSISFLS